MPMMQQNHVGNVSFSTPNSNTVLGFSSQVGWRETHIQENSNAKNGCVYFETGTLKAKEGIHWSSSMR